MTTALISVIVPVYNVQDELKRCIDSILKQTYTNFELLLINDGSTDNSLAICNQVANVDKRIKVYSKQNGGLSDARNFGLQYASGEYVAFIDGDDYVEVDYLKKLYSSISENEADVAVCGFQNVTVNGNLEQVVKFPSETKKMVISGHELLRLVFQDNGYTFVVAWNKLYAKTLFDKVQFEKGKLHEDEYINFPLFWNVSRVSIVNQPLYNYIQRPGSIMNSNFSEEKLLTVFELHQRRIAFYKQKKASELYVLANQAFRNWCVTTNLKYPTRLSPRDRKQLQHLFRKSVMTSPVNKNLKLLMQDILGSLDLRLAANVKKMMIK